MNCHNRDTQSCRQSNSARGAPRLLCRPVAVAAATSSDADNSTATDNPTADSANNALEEVTVLTNTPLQFTEGPGPDRVIQREFYDATLQFGGILNF